MRSLQPDTSVPTSPEALAAMHPAVRTWFERRFPEGPTPAQALGWPEIAAGRDTLIAAPTGSGKTLAAFLVCIDQLYRAAADGTSVEGATQVVYVSPLKALGVDIAQNLEEPLAEIAAVARELGLDVPALRVDVRNGDTPASVRAAMLRRPPNFLVTTPESLYLLVTAERTRTMLASVRTVIVDEIHAVARDKRGSHLALTLERLTHVADQAPVRIGLSATQRPISTIERLLVGSGTAPAAIVDVGHERQLDLAIELPGSELEAVASHEQLGEVLDRVADLAREHRTTLVFVNTRRLSERLAHLLAERLGEDAVASHHGSLSKQRRLRVEQRLRAGDLRVLVATASLELGIDIGPVELVCQIGSPRSLATFLQRVGRSGHQRRGTPKGRLFPLTRDELVECAALFAGIRRGRLDAVLPPVAPLDILAQQVVAECAAQDWDEDDLFELVRGAAPYASLARSDFDAVVELVSEGIVTGRGARGAYVQRDRVNHVLHGRRGARLAALTSGGAIPETGDYRVVADPDDTFVGTVNEDWAIESMAGDVFLLGSTSWRIRRVEPGTVRVVDAGGAPPSVPFWLGEAPARTAELSEEVGMLRVAVEEALGADEDAVQVVEERCGIDGVAAGQVVAYLAAARAALGALPSGDHLVLERFFDDTGGMQLVLHAPFGGRINRALGLALRKRFCVTFDFELQAAASDDAVLISLGPQHSFPLESVTHYLSSTTVEDVLTQAVLASPMFTARWRWNLNRSLAVLRFRGGRRNPPPIQRMESDDLMVAVFPGLAACQENAGAGPVEIPDHLLVRQTVYDCLHEAMDVDGLRALVARLERSELRVTCRDTTEPSPLAHEILNARPYTFLDDAPLEERRSRAVSLRRGLPIEARDLSHLDPAAIARVRDEARPDPRDADELHDLLTALVVTPPEPVWSAWFAELVAARRATSVTPDPDHEPIRELWCPVERRPDVEALFPGARFRPDHPAPDARPGGPGVVGAPDRDDVATSVVRGHLDVLGPVTVTEVAAAAGITPALAAIALARLEQSGFALRGHFDSEPTDTRAPAPEPTGTRAPAPEPTGTRAPAPEPTGTRASAPEQPSARGAGTLRRSERDHEPEQWCARRLLARVHSYTQQRLRAEIEPVSAQDYLRFLLRWQRVTPGRRRRGRAGVLAAIESLQGFELPAGAWEADILPARVDGYRREWLDELCLDGAVAWGRLGLRTETSSPTPRTITSAATPITLMRRDAMMWLMQAARGDGTPAEPEVGATREVLDELRSQGASFVTDLGPLTRRLPSEIEDALWDGVARGLVTADGFSAVRSLLTGRHGVRRPMAGGQRLRRRSVDGGGARGGRWALLPRPAAIEDRDALAEAVAEQLLDRWGVLVRDVIARETLTVPWRDILWALRRMEDRGTIRGGRFVTGFVGEQYARPLAVDELRAVRRAPRTGEVVQLSAADPLNLVGILTPGSRVPAVRTNTVTYRDGAPLGSTDASVGSDAIDVSPTRRPVGSDVERPR